MDLATATGPGGTFTGGAANPVETYSSDGPRKMFYQPNGTAITPGNLLFATNGGTTLQKVDMAAGDCGTTTTPGFIPFCGTSAAAPTAAASRTAESQISSRSAAGRLAAGASSMIFWNRRWTEHSRS